MYSGLPRIRRIRLNEYGSLIATRIQNSKIRIQLEYVLRILFSYFTTSQQQFQTLKEIFPLFSDNFLKQILLKNIHFLQFCHKRKDLNDTL